MAESGHRVTFTCNGTPVDVEVAPGESLLSVLRERLDIMSPKDGCAPQGQCGCCTVLVDGDPRVACVTPVTRVAGRSVTTIEGLDPAVRDAWAGAFVKSGGSQCGFCTPGIVMRLAGLAARGRTARRDVDRALAAHLCRCTGWQTVYEAADVVTRPRAAAARNAGAAARRAEMEGGVAQRVGHSVPLGDGGFADDRAPRDALVAVPAASSGPRSVLAAGVEWVVGESLVEARALAGKVQGRRTSVDPAPPLPLPPPRDGGVRLATSWVEPAYLEPDASWCEPGGEPATPLANGGAFGGKVVSPAPVAARELADHYGRAVRTVFSREDVVRFGPKRPPIAASAVLRSRTVEIDGIVAGTPGEAFTRGIEWSYTIDELGTWTGAQVPGPPVSSALRGVGLAERALLLEGALAEAGVDRASLLRDERAARVLLDTCVAARSGALTGARVRMNEQGAVDGVEIRVAAGDPLDEIVLRSYAIGAAHMALGWVLTEGLATDLTTGEIGDLTIRSFGIVRAQDVPPIDVHILDDDGPPRARASDAVFAAVASALWNAVSDAEGARPEAFPAYGTRAARGLRRR